MRCTWCSTKVRPEAEISRDAIAPHCRSRACFARSLEVRIASESIRRRAVDALRPLPSADSYIVHGQIVPDAVRVEPIDWTRPVEGWVLFLARPT